MSGVVRPQNSPQSEITSRDNFIVTFLTTKYKYHSVGTSTSHQKNFPSLYFKCVEVNKSVKLGKGKIRKLKFIIE
jgi:hypothetical protein